MLVLAVHLYFGKHGEGRLEASAGTHVLHAVHDLLPSSRLLLRGRRHVTRARLMSLLAPEILFIKVNVLKGF